jgi:hypothetical protein
MKIGHERGETVGAIFFDQRKTITVFLCGNKSPAIGQTFTIEDDQFRCTHVSELHWCDEFKSYGHTVEGAYP